MHYYLGSNTNTEEPNTGLGFTNQPWCKYYSRGIYTSLAGSSKPITISLLEEEYVIDESTEYIDTNRKRKYQTTAAQ